MDIQSCADVQNFTAVDFLPKQPENMTGGGLLV